MAKKITPEEVDLFVSLYRSGKNTPEISELTSRSLRAVCYSLKNAGIELRAEQPNQTPRELEDRTFALYQEGHIRAEIARITGLRDTTVRSILRRRLGHEPDWDNPERRARRAEIWGNPENQPARTPPETEDLILTLYRDGIRWDQIADAAHVSVKTVANVLARRGVAASRTFKLIGPQRLRILKMIADGADISAICAATGLTEDAAKQFTAYGRESAFSVIDTPEKAYWLGFLNADGAILGVNPGTLRLQVVLARKDRDHLVKLRAFLGIEREIWDYEARTIGGALRPYSRLICQERPVVMDLARHGILPNKTGAEKPWADGPADLMPHYWRGMIDGDGSVPDKSFTVTLCGSYEVISAFIGWAREVCGTRINPSRDKRSPRHWRAIMGGRASVSLLLNVLYSDASVALNRKKALADLALQEAASG